MNESSRAAAPASGSLTETIPTFEELAADPEIAALLDFEPVPRKIEVERGWSPAKQREFIARLAVHGSQGKASAEMNMDRGGVRKLYNSAEGASFRSAWHDAIELAARRRTERAPDGPAPACRPPTLDNRRKSPSPASGEADWGEPEPGQLLNEYGEWEEEDSLRQRAEEARDSIAAKLRNARRLYLQEISGCPGKRAAFEMLTELPIDWDKAATLEPQDDEPWARPNMRNPDMLLTAENGWLGEYTHGRDKKAELRKAVDAYREAEGLPPVDWDGD